MSPAPHAAATLTWLLLIALIPLGPVLGSASGIVASVVAITLIPFAARHDAWLHVRGQPAVLLMLVAFVALGVCFAITADEPHDVLFAFNFISLPLAAAVFLVALRSYPDPSPVIGIALLSLAGALAALVVSANDVFLRDLDYVYGFNMGPHVVARLALLLGFLSLSGILASCSSWRFLLYLGPLAALAVVYLSGTRGAVVVLPVLAIIFVGFLVLVRARVQVTVIALLALIAAAALALSSDRLASIGRVASELFSTGATSDGSTAERLAMLTTAWQLFAASPVIGHGWGNFSTVAYPVLQTGGGPADPFFQFHNDLANFTVAAGLVGTLCWIALLAAPIIGALASPRDVLFHARLYCCLILSAWAFSSGLTDFTLGYDLPTTLYAFLTALVLGAFRPPPAAPTTIER